MALETPSASEIVSRMQTDVAREVTGSNPRLANSWLWGVVVGLAQRVFDFYYYLQQVALQHIPDTATGEWLARWAAIWRQTRNPATQATGIVVFNSNQLGIGTFLPPGTGVTTSDGLEYESTGYSAVASDSRSATIESTGTLATATTSTDRGLSSIVVVTISGAGQAAYNGTFSITVTGSDTFTYTMASDPSSPATGTILASWVSLPLHVESIEMGVEFNQVFDTVLSLQSPVAYIDTDGQVYYEGLTGGADQEDDEALRIRMLDALQNPISHFSVSEIIQAAKAVAGVTRVWVREVTPAIGQVTVHFMRDNDVPPIPSSTTAVKAALDAIRPANTDTDDVIVTAPTPVETDYTFSALSPNTSTMQAAITANLQRFYAEDTEVDDGVTVDGDVLEVAYLAAIYNTVDTVTGETVSSFALSAPTTDITVDAGEIGTLGTITYP